MVKCLNLGIKGKFLGPLLAIKVVGVGGPVRFQAWFGLLMWLGVGGPDSAQAHNQSAMRAPLGAHNLR